MSAMRCTDVSRCMLRGFHGYAHACVVQVLMSMNFSSRTTSLDVQRHLLANVEKRGKETYGPPLGKKLLVFVDDMNMPQVSSHTHQSHCGWVS